MSTSSKALFYCFIACIFGLVGFVGYACFSYLLHLYPSDAKPVVFHSAPGSFDAEIEVALSAEDGHVHLWIPADETWYDLTIISDGRITMEDFVEGGDDV